MCVIVAKYKEVDLPTLKELENCFDSNSDGAGFMYTHNNKVIIDKGYMTWNNFKKRYEKLCRKYNNFKNKSLVMHFRIGTSSGNTPQNTHPYPIYKDTKENDLHKKYVKCNLGMVHNGIIRDYTPKIKNPTTNDTQEFVLRYLTPLYANYPEFYKNKYILNGLEDITNSKLCFLDTNDDIYWCGDYVEHNGVIYSNNSYLDWEPYYYSNYSNYKYTPKIYDYDNEKDEEEFDTYNCMGLEPTWYVEYDGKYEEVGDRDLIYDFEYMKLYNCYDGELTLLANNCYVYDENYELIY